jgi:hypothetical protein
MEIARNLGYLGAAERFPLGRERTPAESDARWGRP